MGLRSLNRPRTTPEVDAENRIDRRAVRRARRGVAGLWGVAGEAGVARRIRQGDVEDDVLAELLDGRQRHGVGRLFDGWERPEDLAQAGAGEQEDCHGEADR